MVNSQIYLLKFNNREFLVEFKIVGLKLKYNHFSRIKKLFKLFIFFLKKWLYF